MANEAYDRAMERIRDEMAGSKDMSTQSVGEMMTALLAAYPEWGAAIAAAGQEKTLAGLYAKMRKVAQGKQKDQCYYMPPTEAEALAREWYGIEAQAHAGGELPPTPAGPPPSEREAFGELDALLAGL